MRVHLPRNLYIIFLLLFQAGFAGASDSDELLIVEEESEQLLIIEEGPNTASNSVAEEPGSDELLLISDEVSEGELILDESTEISDLSQTSGASVSGNAEAHPGQQIVKKNGSTEFGLDELWLEAGHFLESGASYDSQLYGKIGVLLKTQFDRWEIQASARLDGYSEIDGDNWDKVGFDYDETFIRYNGENRIVTVGAQKILWGRIDEFPPVDRLSTQDYRRIYDDLEDRRLASLAIRYEQFFDSGKLDVAIYPKFREAQLPDSESIWFPVNRSTGKLVGLETTPTTEAIVMASPMRENAPDSDGGFGIRYTSIGSVDYGLSIQRGLPSAPYFAYNPSTMTIEGRYPRTWIVGANAGVEALGGTLKFEAAWLSDIPITETDSGYTTTKGVNWGVALEIFPGDGDARVNLQVTGQTLLDTDNPLDREDMASFNGTLTTPFANNTWRCTTRFSVGLDEEEYYLNPELAYTGIDGQEIYLELHWFDGDEGTIGGFYSDASLISAGWRLAF